METQALAGGGLSHPKTLPSDPALSPKCGPLPPGNGPSGICLSYLLSGYTPYVKPDAVHPHPLLQRKLSEAPGVSIMDQVSQSSRQGGRETHLPKAKLKGMHLRDTRPNV